MRTSYRGMAICILVTSLALCHIAGAEPTAPAVPEPRLSSPLPTDAGHFKLRYFVTIQGKPRDLCLVVSNSKKIAQTKGKVPVLIFLHGSDERGSNGDLVFVNGPSAVMMRDPALNDSMPMMIVSPQVPIGLALGGPRMGPESMVQLVDILAADPRVDPDRIYLTGVSMGGRGTWVIAAADPKAFAAIVPVAPSTVDIKKVAPFVKDIPIWMVYGDEDDGIAGPARDMAEALKQAGAAPDVSEIAGANHETSWPRIYANPLFYDWLLTHVRGQPASKHFTSDELLKIATRPIDDPIATGVEHDFGVFEPYWQIVNCAREGKPGLRDQVNGKKNVFVITPLSGQVPCVMQTEAAVESGKRLKLNFIVGQDQGIPWRMVVNGDNGKLFLDKTIDSTTTKDGWLETSVDFGVMTRNHIHLQVLVYQQGDKPGPAYFAKMAVDQQ